eukprot:Blabericola_migrator_1__10173@NODE_5683_length_700_cov_6_881517_g3712_i0_p1_GENE_NODE_5683_length_700_cov_6_881517_g3712_i0NODE_5683_length_700_cov_6_881517_g3712_i0_p1_ORF_typecomplete_len113_score0_66_NODE_5683_length_700_cov_6_881517_g3712_i093431
MLLPRVADNTINPAADRCLHLCLLVTVFCLAAWHSAMYEKTLSLFPPARNNTHRHLLVRSLLMMLNMETFFGAAVNERSFPRDRRTNRGHNVLRMVSTTWCESTPLARDCVI